MMLRLLILIAAVIGLARPAGATPVLLISIDGLRPGGVIEADRRGLKLPHLRRLLADGAHATGVIGVLPTVTYPSHATLLTGVAPARHGIVHNLSFDPVQMNQAGWDWYASHIRVPTLWQAARRAGLTTGNVHWPVSVGARGIDWNLPQIWRTGHPDDAALLAALATPGLVARLERGRGEPYPLGIDESIDGDERRGRFAEQLIRMHRPDFLTVYLAALDHQQHADGPGSPAARAVLERIDAVVGRLIAAQRAARPGSVIAVVSDHGFAPVTRQTNLHRAFIDAGLITIADGRISSWDAVPVVEDGSAAIILARPEDAALVARVGAVLDRLRADPDNGIAAIIGRADQLRMGGNPAASFYVGMAPGTVAGDFAGAGAPLSAPAGGGGSHGFLPADPAMHATFIVAGPGIPRGHSLGTIDMRAIAPTLARIMGAPLTSADLPPLRF